MTEEAAPDEFDFNAKFVERRKYRHITRHNGQQVEMISLSLQQAIQQIHGADNCVGNTDILSFLRYTVASPPEPDQGSTEFLQESVEG